MGSFHPKGREQSLVRRDGLRGRRRLPLMESLETRTLLSGDSTSRLASLPADVNAGVSPAVAPLVNTTSPVVNNTTFNGRFIKIVFSEAIDPSTVNKTNIVLLRAGGSTNGFANNPSGSVVTDDGRAVVSYDTTSNTATIDLSALPQGSLPTDHYELVIFTPGTAAGRPGVRDTAGNPLNGQFNGTFPSGAPVTNPPTPPSPFVQDLGVRTLAPPAFNSLGLAPGSDTGIAPDNNTNIVQPTFSGQIGATFPGTVAGVTILAEFNGLHNGSFDLNVGAGGRYYTGNYDAFTVTDANGNFTLRAPANLPDGLNRVRFLALNPHESETPATPGLSSIQDLSFRVDTTLPTIDKSGTHLGGASLANNSNVSSLPNLSLYFIDAISPGQVGSPLAVPTQLAFPAIDPSTANNLSNYSLYLLNGPGGTPVRDESAFISTATFVTTTNRTSTNQPYTGTVNLTFATGLPAGYYTFVAHTAEPGFSGLRDAAGNPLSGNPGAPGTPADYFLNFQLQPEPAYITSVQALSPDGTQSGPRSFFEVPQPGTTPRAEAPPNQFIIDFSNPLVAGVDYTNRVQLIASANTAGGAVDGNFGDLGITDSGNGYSRVAGTTVSLTSSIPGARPGQPGYNNRLIMSLAPGTTLSPDYYRLYLPNATSAGTAITDFFGSQLDGEFLGNQTANGSYQDLLPNGQQRAGLSGDTIPGGAFLTGYVVVPNGNIIYAKPGAADDPYNPANAPDGSLAKPFPTLAPQAIYTAANGGDLNSSVNFGTGFNPAIDRMGSGQFHRSALYAAQVAASNGPVVVVALPGQTVTDPNTGVTSQQTFVLQAPSGTDPLINDGSVAVPALTTLAFEPGAVLKLENASLLVQNQGSALQALGGANPGQQVVFTSYANDAVAGDTNHDASNTVPRGGDWGGILFRNYDETNRSATFPGQLQTTANTNQNNRLKGPGGADAISGGDDVMSVLNFSSVSYGGGAVPQTIGFRYDAITLQNSRPAITNTSISQTGGATGAQAAISANVDSLREDANARGPLVRQVSFASNSLNGIYIRAEVNGIAEATNAISYPGNPSTLGGQRNFTLDSPYPYLLTTPMVVGGLFLQETGGATSGESDRLYIQPGMMVKLSSGAGIEVRGSSTMNVGDRTYLNEFDANRNLGPLLANGQPNPTFRANTTGDAGIVFTSLYDNTAATSFFDPNTGLSTQVVAPLDSPNSGSDTSLQPKIVNGVVTVDPRARWGGIQIDSPAVAVIDEATVQFGGGLVNTPGGSTARHALEFAGAGGFGSSGSGTHVSITNNNFFGNADVPMNITGDGLLAADPARPLQSGKPFIRGNILQNNDVNGLGVVGIGANQRQFTNVDVNSVWDLTDVTYIVRGTMALNGSFLPPQGSETGLSPIPAPAVTLTIQSLLPGTVLANGQTVAKPGESPVIKLQGAAPPLANETTPTLTSEDFQGAGFVVGMDNGIDPPADPLIDNGVNSAIRFVGIGANQTTGQSRVPVIITSIHDQTVGTTARGVTMNQVLPNDTTAPAAGDGGNITFGALAATSYNLLDPRLGNIIDNADIRYISSIQQIGGGIIRVYDTNGDGGFDLTDPYYAERLGQPVSVTASATAGGATSTNYGDQFNQPNAMTVSNSNFASFSQIGFYAHPGFPAIFVAQNYMATPPIFRSGFIGEPTNTFFVNNTFSNMPVAIQIDSPKVDNPAGPSPDQAILLNNTFYKDAIGFNVNSAVYDGINSLSHVQFLAMNNIFDGSTTAGINSNGQIWDSQGQNNLYFNDTANTVVTNSGPSDYRGDIHSFTGDPAFVNPDAGNFALRSTSAAIDSARSEIGPYSLGNMLTPAATQDLSSVGGIRNPIGRSNSRGGLLGDGFITPQDYIFLPGSPIPNFISEFVPALPGSPGSSSGPFSNAATFNFVPTSTERDQAGNQRIDYPLKPNLGSGSSPFFDIGAYEFIQLFPPHVTSVTATFTDPTNPTGVTTKSIYSVGSIAGANGAPQTIQFQLDHNLDPNTINNRTVLLQASGGDGIFGNGNSSSDRFIDLSGKLSFNPLNNVLTISLANSGLTLTNDEYRLILLGTGSQVLRDPQGNALDGENLDANGNQRDLPTGDTVPGGNTVVTFTIDTNPPAIVPGSYYLDLATDSNYQDGITNISTPNFQGNITDIFPPLNFLAGQTVAIDISTRGDGVFDILNAGTGVTDVNGHFSVKIAAPLPDSNYNVGPDGILAFDYSQNPRVKSNDDSGYSLARVRISDQAGNVSNSVTAPLSSFIAAGAVTSFVVDTTAPQVVSVTPSANASAPVTPSGVPITVTFNENVDPKSINATSIRVVRSGGDGIFGNANDVPVSIDPNSISVHYLGGQRGTESVTFDLIGTSNAPLGNDQYRVTLSGKTATGVTAVTDIAGNALDGAGNGVAGSDSSSTFVVFSPSLAHNLFVGPAFDATNSNATIGDRTNPYPTIAAAIAAAKTGDVVAVLPGVYTESLVLKSLIILRSADIASTDTILLPGDPLQTIIRAPALTASSRPTQTGATVAAITGVNIVSVAGGATLNTQVTGFTIANSLVGNPATGPIQSGSVGIDLVNADIVVDHNYFIDSNVGVSETASGTNAIFPRIFNDGIIGNTVGLSIDGTTVSSLRDKAQVYNNTIAFNNQGVGLNVSDSSPILAVFANNIFWQNHDLTSARNGNAFVATAPDKVILRSNLFSANGALANNPADDTSNISRDRTNVGLFFDPSILVTTHTDSLGNFTGNPAFVSPRDPRPTADGPATFFIDANFDLTQNSAAIDRSNPAYAPSVDFLYRGRVLVPGHAFPAGGPNDQSIGAADVGAFERNGTGGRPSGGQAFRVVSTSLAQGGAPLALGQIVPAIAAPSSVTVNFSENVNKATVVPNDLILSGSGVSASNPIHATSLSWIDDHTVKFNLSGGYNKTGIVSVNIPENAIRDVQGRGNFALSDAIRLGSTAAQVVPAVATAAVVAPVVHLPVAAPTIANHRKVAKPARRKA